MGQMRVAEPDRVDAEFLETVAGLGMLDPVVRAAAKASPFSDDDEPVRQDDMEPFEDDDLDDTVVDWP